LAKGETAIPALDAAVTCDAPMQQWRLALVNRHPAQEIACRLIWNGRPLNGRFFATVLAGDSADAYNDVQQPDRVTPAETTFDCVEGILRLPAHSISIVRVA